MNLRDLTYLVALADHRHFGRAAEACFVSQPTLSTQIKKLEAELGAQLFERNPGQVLLTAAGEQVVERARRVLTEVDTIQRIAIRASDPDAATLRIGLIPTIAPYLLPHVVPSLSERFPKAELLLVEEKTDVLLDRLRTGLIDAAVLAMPIASESLEVDRLYDEEFVLAVPAGHRLAAEAGPVSYDVLAAEQVLLLEEGHCLREHALEVCQMAGAMERHGFRATSLETLRQMVAAGVGVTLLPALSVTPPAQLPAAVHLRRFTPPAPRREVALVWRRTSVFGQLLPQIAETVRDAVAGVLDP